ncbi:MAG TPA: RNA 2',3'-cyclic phosphodiesterase [Pyrinomonadaceae bacterium]|nr:RNA 2',3'-cyclic phosphodiesterase [Pyrinomonadaceae bacterium]
MSLRVFCAVELPEDVRRAAAGHVARLRAEFPQLKVGWEREEKLHLTLKFLGEIEEARVERLSRAAGEAAAAARAFEISIEGTGLVPPRGAPRVLWLGVRDETRGLALLNERLEDACAAEGFARETRDFRPHLTVARLRTPEGVRPLASLHAATEFAARPFEVRELVVMQSQLGPGGSRYTALSRHALS